MSNTIQYIDFRPMSANDINAVMQVELSVYPYPWTKGILGDCIRTGYDCWVATDNKKIIGHGVLSVAAGESHLLNLAVDPDYQGQGIGRKLLAHLMDIARIKSADMILLEVRPSNKAAIHIYESTGFNEIGCRKAYYPAPKGKEDALLFACQF
ncbi:MAG: ribosomal protein S18-alanine N-acetyltransferase [Gammaproteobacteria bacterium]|nr:ribosomal protein S18-alanine N-acetyltransferase [Gammaproteobacteria bacterium]